jgi:glycosyltransferase involved in cell wall biosynthesis
MKILLVTFTYPPNRDGVSEASRILVGYLLSKGHEVIVATGILDNRTFRHGRESIREFKIEGGTNWRSGFTGQVQEYQKFLLITSFDILFFQCWDVWTTALALPLFDRISGKKVLISHGFSAHEWTPHRRPPWGLVSWLFRLPSVIKAAWILRQFDQVVFLSKRQDWGRFLDVGIAQWTGFKKCKVIPNSIRLQDFQKTVGCFRKKHHFAESFLVLCLANYSDRKNQQLTLDVFHQAGLKDAILCFIGESFNAYSEELEKMAARLDFGTTGSRVLFFERLGRESIAEALVDCDLVLLTARQETQPIALLEAMAAGKPFISTNRGCVEDYPGGLVANSSQELVSCLKEMMADPVRRSDLGRKGYRYIQEHHDQDTVLQSYGDLMDELVFNSRI